MLLTGCPFLNKLPVWTAIPNLIKNLGDSVNFSLSAYCSDPDGDPLTFSVSSGPGTYSWKQLRMDCYCTLAGEKTIVVSASDGKGSTTASFKITCVKTAPNIPSNPSPSDNSTGQELSFHQPFLDRWRSMGIPLNMISILELRRPHPCTVPT